MKKNWINLSLCIYLFSLFSINAKTRGEQVSIPQTEKHYIKSKINKDVYAVDVWLPRDYYKKTKKSYPVIFLTDSELNFPLVSFAVRRLIKNKNMPEVILIGISHNTTYEDWYYIKRARDLTPVVWGHKDFPITGKAKQFTKILTSEIISFVQNKYRILSNEKTLAGMSFGGLYAHYVMFNYNKIFNRYLIVSPSVWYGKRFLIKDEARFSKKNKALDARIYTAAGSREKKYFIEDWKELNKNIISRKYLGVEMKEELLDDEDHRSISPRAFMNGLRYLFKNYSK